MLGIKLLSSEERAVLNKDRRKASLIEQNRKISEQIETLRKQQRELNKELESL